MPYSYRYPALVIRLEGGDVAMRPALELTRIGKSGCHTALPAKPERGKLSGDPSLHGHNVMRVWSAMEFGKS